jgi:hypothetical protein
VTPDKLTRNVFITTFLAVIAFVGVTLLLNSR